MANPEKNSPVAEQLKDMLTSDTTPVAVKCAKVALSAADTAGGILAWQNPEASAIVVLRLLIDLTTAATGAVTADFGPAANATTSSDTLIDGVDLNTATGVFDNFDNPGNDGKSLQRLDAKGGTTDHVTGSLAAGAAAGLKGNAYIFYMEV